MRNRASTFAAAALLALLAVAACSSNGSPAATATYSLFDCPAGQPFATAPACTSCIQTSCPSYLTGANSACASFIDCVCPGTVDASSCANGPAETALEDGGVVETPCGAAVGNLRTCVTYFCSGACTDGDGG